MLNTNGLGGNDVGASFSNVRADYNNDGFEDVAVSNVDGEQFKLWRNDNQTSNHWLKVDLVGVASNRDDIGCWVSAHANQDKYVRYSHLGDGYLGQNSDYILIGMAGHASIDSLLIEWPSGIVDKYYDLECDQFLKITEGTSTSNPNPCPYIQQYSISYTMDGTYKADYHIISSSSVISTDHTIISANNYVELQAGFEFLPNDYSLLIDNDGCSN